MCSLEQWGAEPAAAPTPASTTEWGEAKDWSAAAPATKEWGAEETAQTGDWGTSVTMKDSTAAAEWA